MMKDGAEVRLVVHTDEVVKKIGQAAAQKMLEAVNEVRNVTLETLSGSRTGRTYYVPDTKRQYTASAPGEPPAQATGRLRQSVEGVVEGEGKDLAGIVGTPLAYGKRLEFGDSEIEPRPWLRVSFEKATEKVKQILGKRWIP